MGNYLPSFKFGGDENQDYKRISQHEKSQLDSFPIIEETTSSDPPTITVSTVLSKSDDRLLNKTLVVKGPEFNNGINYDKLFKSYKVTGFQASNLSQSIDIINKMLKWRLFDDPINKKTKKEFLDKKVRMNTKCKIFLSCTSNMISAGLREVIRFLVEHKLIHVLVTSSAGIESDLLKCLGDIYLGSFRLDGKLLKSKNINRVGNLLNPNSNYLKFHKWLTPILDEMLNEQKEQGTIWTPSKIIHRLGMEINNKESICYWAYKNKIPIYCPALTDGFIGNCMYFHAYKNPGLIVDVVRDIIAMNNEAVFPKTTKTGMVLLGGGTSKHHVCNANLMGGGASYSVFINTGQEFDGSDSGARPDEAKSWGKIKPNAECSKIYGDATIVFPIIVAETFAKFHFAKLKKAKLHNKKDFEVVKVVGNV